MVLILLARLIVGWMCLQMIPGTHQITNCENDSLEFTLGTKVVKGMGLGVSRMLPGETFLLRICCDCVAVPPLAALQQLTLQQASTNGLEWAEHLLHLSS
jgi:hypothetical protein